MTVEAGAEAAGKAVRVPAIIGLFRVTRIIPLDVGFNSIIRITRGAAYNPATTDKKVSYYQIKLKKSHNVISVPIL